MRIAIMQPYFMPYIGYFQLINAVDKFIIYDDVNFIKKGWINRNNILANKSKMMFTIPLKKASQNEVINKVEISSDDFRKWKDKFFKTLSMSYRNAKRHDVIMELLSKILSYETNFISELAVHSILEVCKYLEIETDFVLSSSVYCNAQLNGQERILDICLKEDAITYINPIGGIELYSNNFFLEKDIELRFIKTDVIPYKQFSEEFIPFLSIIDILMFSDKKYVVEQLSSFKLA